MITTTTSETGEGPQAANPETGLVPARAAPLAEVSSPVRFTPVPHTHRRHKRARAEELLIKVRIGDGLLVARVEDISIGGLFARTQKVIPIGAFVEMGLLRPGHEELGLTGVVVADSARRAGLAITFQGVDGPARAELRRVVLDQQVKSAVTNEVSVETTRAMRPASDELVGRDRELEELRRRIAQLSAENEQLRGELEAVGRALEIERLRSRSGDDAVDPELLASLKRDTELAWTAIARLSDTCEKIR
ncbi:MAG: PilZ domain-containing protein [Deltaproteobacteria bacterium]|nr:PilZ domain-containing protein [Deltaproteobacteria bacterium]